MKDTTDAAYMHAKKSLCKDFEIKNLDKYHDRYLKKYRLLLADVFENLRKMYLKKFFI